MIDFGKYDQRVSFLTYQDVPDGYGGTIPEALEVVSTFAWVKQISGGNDIEQAQLGLPDTYKVGIQIRAGFTPNASMMVDYRGVIYKINGIEKIDQRQAREWVITIIGGKESINVT
jgi:SPP1 family predicted phage head-tail adaptor